MKYAHALIRAAQFALAVAIPFCAAACAKVTAGKVPYPVGAKDEKGNIIPIPDGQHYFLPKPMVVYSLQDDGTMKATIEYVADPNHEYTIQAASYAAKHSVDVDTTPEGFLKTVTYKPDSTAVATQAATSAGNIGKAFLDQAKADKDAAKTAADAAKKAQETDKKAKEDALAKADAANKAAEAKVKTDEDQLVILKDAVLKAKDDKAKEAAQVEVQKLELLLAADRVTQKFAEDYYNDLKKAPGNIPGATKDEPGAATTRNFSGPIVYTINDTGNSVELLPIVIQTTTKPAATQPAGAEFGQIKFETANFGLAKSEEAKTKGKITLKPPVANDKIPPIKEGGTFQIEKIDGECKSITVTISFKADDKKIQTETYDLTKNKLPVTFTLNQSITENKEPYDVTITPDDKKAVEPVIFTVIVEKK